MRINRGLHTTGTGRIDKYGNAVDGAVSRLSLEAELCGGDAAAAAAARAEAGASGLRQPLTAEDGAQILDAAMSDAEGLRRLLRAACAVRSRMRGPAAATVTFSKKSFFNIVNLCRDACSYCTYRSGPQGARAAAVAMSPRDVSALAEASLRHNCVEALLVAGERPEERHEGVRSWLAGEGYASTAEYIVHCSEMLLEAGLFPHTNAGNLSRRELADLSRTNASIGLMLESSSARLGGAGMPHENAPSKDPAARLAVLRDAGALRIPTTTGVLVGIGETHAELAESLLAIDGVHRRHGHIQEVIVQNFQPEPGTAMGGAPPAGPAYLAAAAALARLYMPAMNIQVPPNLSPGSYQDALGAGINDWGGISPLTPDHVNPEFAWPSMPRLEERTRRAGMRLSCRFPVYPEYVRMVPRRIKDRMARIAEEGGTWLVGEEYWRGP